jgi:hypothetical protein
MQSVKLVAAVLFVVPLSCGIAAAETVKWVETEDVAGGSVCYYQSRSGFAYHYFVPNSSWFSQPQCAASLETPVGVIDDAQLIKDEVVGSDRYCHFGYRGQVVVQKRYEPEKCWRSWKEKPQPEPIAKRVLVREESFFGDTETKLCFYDKESGRTAASVRFLMRSKRGTCPKAITVG